MIFWILAAILTAYAVGSTVTPLMQARPRLALALTIVLPLVTMGLYMLLGNPVFAG